MALLVKILRGLTANRDGSGIPFRSHWGYQSEYCNPASGNEKGGVERELGWYRRNCLVPVPEVATGLNGSGQKLHMKRSVCRAELTSTVAVANNPVGMVDKKLLSDCSRYVLLY
jgi:transposase